MTLPSKTLTTHAVVLGSTGSGKTGLLIAMVEELNKKSIPVVLVDIKGDMANVAIQDPSLSVYYIAPGSEHGEEINILNDLGDSSNFVLLNLLDKIKEKPNGTAHLFLKEEMKLMYKPSLEQLVYSCLDPQNQYMGVLALDEAFSPTKRKALAIKLNTFLSSDYAELWGSGRGIDMDEIAGRRGITIYSVASLNDENDKAFAISYLLNKVFDWAKSKGGSDSLRMAVVIDECVGLLPPTANPPTKEPILTILKQARAFGLGCILGTQNPVDIDYKALANCNTWFIGRMNSEQDRAKVASGIAALSGDTVSDVKDSISLLLSRNFLVRTAETTTIFRTRQTNAKLQGPLLDEDIYSLYQQGWLTYSYDLEIDQESEDAPKQTFFRLTWPLKKKHVIAGVVVATVYKVFEWIMTP